VKRAFVTIILGVWERRHLVCRERGNLVSANIKGVRAKPYFTPSRFLPALADRMSALPGALPGALAFVLLLCLSGPLAAQSGRRASKPPAAANSPETNTNKTDAGAGVDGKASNKPLSGNRLNAPVKLLIARQVSSKHLLTEDVISASFVKRLNEFTDVTAISVGDLKRDEAVKRAKNETDSFVVWLQFGIDSFQRGTVILNSQSLNVEYSVLAARSGKQQAKGKVYYQPVGSGRMRKSDWPNGTPIKITPEAAGIDAAEQLFYSVALIVGVKPVP
jgi:hypothetical protein